MTKEEEKKKLKGLLYLIPVFCIVPIIFLIVLISTIGYVKTSGSIESNDCVTKTRTDDDGKKEFYSVCELTVRFVDSNGKEYTVSTTESDTSLSAGDEVTVYYNKKNPKKIELNIEETRNSGIAVLIISIFSILVLIVVYIVGVKHIDKKYDNEKVKKE